MAAPGGTARSISSWSNARRCPARCTTAWRPALNPVAFAAAGRAEVDRLTDAAPAHGWRLLFADRHPHAGGPDSYAAYFQDAWGYEVEFQCDGYRYVPHHRWLW